MSAADDLVLLDTNILVHYVRGSSLADEIESELHLRASDRAPLVSAVSVGEMLALGNRLGWGHRKLQKLEGLTRKLVVVGIDSRSVLEAYGEISSWTESKGQKMGQNDLWIAATARATRAHLVTTDTDFDRLDPRFLRRTLYAP